MKSKVLSILLSLVIAFGLWMYVITEERTQIEETFYNVPVIMQTDGLNKNLMILSDGDPTISLKLYGNRSTLNKLRSSDIVVLVDLSKISEPGTKRLSYTVSFPGDIQNGSIEIMSRQPEQIEVEIAEKEEKEIPVIVQTSGRLPEGFKIDTDNQFWDPKNVKISGPKDLVGKIHMGKVVVNLDGKETDIEDRIRMQLCDENGNPVEDVSRIFVDGPGNVTVKIPIVMEKEITVMYNLIYGEVLTGETAKQTNPVKTITVYGKKELVEALGDTVVVEIDLSDLKEGFENQQYDLGLPEGITSNIGDTVPVSIVYTPLMVVNLSTLLGL